jgi:VWFA-related protein
MKLFKGLLLIYAGFSFILSCSPGLFSQTPIAAVEKIDYSKFSSSHPVIHVFINVVDGKGHFITDLTRDDFELFLNQKRITNFSVGKAFSSKEWIAVSTLVDISGSMKGKPFEDEKIALKEFVNNMGIYDKICLMTFNEKPTIPLEFTRDRERFLETLAAVKVKGNTALYDAIDMALTYSKKILSPRKAIIVLTDGLDTRSKISVETLFQKLSMFYIPVFTISLGNNTNNEVLKKIADKTGGRFYFSPDSDDLLSIYIKIAENLKNAYMLKDVRVPAAAEISVSHLKIGIPRFNINIAYDFGPADSVFKEQLGVMGVKKIHILKIIAGKNIYFTIVLALIILIAILFAWFYFSNRYIVLKLIITLCLLILYLVLQFIVYFYIKI